MFRVKTKIMESRPADVARDAWRGICKDSMAHVADYWHQKILPRHFTAQAKYTYQHKPRSNKYRDRKKKLAERGQAVMGGMVDNVLTGNSMRALLKKPVIRTFPTRATLYMSVPFYFDIKFNRSSFTRDGGKNKPSQQPNKPQEITAKTANELAELRKIIGTYVTKRLQNYRGSRKTTTV